MTPDQSPAWLDALCARDGIVCAIGAGGKKTTLYALAAAHTGRVGLTTTVFMTRFSRRLDAHRLITDEVDIEAAVGAASQTHNRLAWARPSSKSGRVAGIAVHEVAPCHAAGAFDVTLVKADGARMRAIKAPNEQEPAVPAETTTVLVLLSAAALGAPLSDQIAHRPERITELTGLRTGDTITPQRVGHLFAAPDGALRNLPSTARWIVVINAVDNARRAEAARLAARAILTESPGVDRVVLTCHADQPRIVDTLERS